MTAPISRTESLPTVDLSNFDGLSSDARQRLAAHVADACREVGFFYLSGHGVDNAKIAAVKQAVVSLFALPAARKQKLRVALDDYHGYIPFAAFGWNDDDDRSDHYEGYKLHREIAPTDPVREQCSLYAPNRWPPGVPNFREAVLAYWHELDRLSHSLLRLFALALGQHESRFLPYFKDSLTNMTLLHYPEIEEPSAGSGIHPHKDIDAFTILHPTEVSGLEVHTRDHRWIAVAPSHGALLVNIGNMMELWSGGRFVSTPHRVTNPTGAPRYSFPYFAIPRYDVLVESVLPRLDGFDKPAVRSEFIVGELYRTNWKAELPSHASVDVGAVR